MLELAFRPDRRRGAPLYRQLADHLRELVEAGRLRLGQKLPATRELAVSLGVSRTTANLAYESLVEAGLARAHVGQGTFVAEPPKGAALPLTGLAGAPPPAGRAGSPLATAVAAPLAGPRDSLRRNPCASNPSTDPRPCSAA